MTWTDGEIAGCEIRKLRRLADARGWLAEFFRHDELPAAVHPVMGYLSMTLPGVTRGPHEHREQTDLFVFLQGTFRLYLWDTRPHSPTAGCRQVVDLGGGDPTTVLIPPGVVHAYRNTGDEEALLVNCPNRLYAGEGKQETVDEIRHEDREDSPFRMD